MPDATPVSTAMKEIQRQCEQRANESSPDDTAPDDEMPNDEMPNEDAPNDPDAADERALRWGRYVVEHFKPQEGDVFLIKGPRGEDAADNRAQMADALMRVLAEKGIENYQIIRGPTSQVSITQISDEQMRELGYVRKSDATPPTPPDA